MEVLINNGYYQYLHVLPVFRSALRRSLIMRLLVLHVLYYMYHKAIAVE